MIRIFAAFRALTNILDDTSSHVVTPSGWALLNDPDKMKLVDLEIEKYKNGDVDEVVIEEFKDVKCVNCKLIVNNENY
jgi:hypothetical protein